MPAQLGERAAEELFAQSRFAWNWKCTSLRLAIKNNHPTLALERYISYLRYGACKKFPEPSIPPWKQTEAIFDDNIGSHRIKGCLLYRIRSADHANSTGKELYLLLAWTIKLSNNASLVLELIENNAGTIVWTHRRLKAHYDEYVCEQLSEASGSLKRTWTLDESQRFTVKVSTGNARNGALEVHISDAAPNETDGRRPFFIAPKKFDSICWDPQDGGHAAHQSPPRTITAKSRASIYVHNSTTSLLLHNASLLMFDGKHASDDPVDIIPQSYCHVIVKAAKPLRKNTRGCLVYELVRSSTGMPIIWGRRTFVAIDVCVALYKMNERKVAVKLFTVIDAHASPPGSGLVKTIHEELLDPFMHTYGRSSRWHAGAFGLKLDVSFNREARTILHVRLSECRSQPGDSAPLFIPTGRYCTHPGIAEQWKKLDASTTNQVCISENETANFVLAAHDASRRWLYSVNSHANSNQDRMHGHNVSLHILDAPSEERDSQQFFKIASATSDAGDVACLFRLTSTLHGDLTANSHIYRHTATMLYAPLLKHDNGLSSTLADGYIRWIQSGKEQQPSKMQPCNTPFPKVGFARKQLPRAQFSEAQLVDYAIQMPDGRGAQLTAYQPINPRHLLGISLRNTPSVKELYGDDTHTAPRPYQVCVTVRSECPKLQLQLVDFIASGAPVTSMQMPETPSACPSVVQFEFSSQDFWHMVVLRYRCSGDKAFGMDIHTNLAILDAYDGDGDRRQTTTVCYAGAVEGEASLVTAYTDMSDSDSGVVTEGNGVPAKASNAAICTDNASIAQAMTEPEGTPSYQITIQHGGHNNNLFSFNTIVTIDMHREPNGNTAAAAAAAAAAAIKEPQSKSPEKQIGTAQALDDR
ncbi:hypothetical protein THASP1DRAFT_31219 [Thamnocephalis sphaerospora]|uniref:Uncharacterized protein n=1 Tax=Thamnocephalis sphaerospora TaxID=78915 RepID=A0A4P9XNZ9_9FUNG|nr:hypothetical protein THASP1DRAFT_31219 [Thamnocephalis sphaerospora]|eukprot:RKP06970.1 hypothetical protein THASP1DRAFT_31219 [Thamnocephalis sphaerospora]